MAVTAEVTVECIGGIEREHTTRRAQDSAQVVGIDIWKQQRRGSTW